MRVIFGVLGMAALWGAAPARADAIDGAWCRENSQRLMINGPAITTAAGSKAQGEYSRHAFSYVAPAGDPAAGGTIQMRLVNEDTMRLWTGAQASASAETWVRCGPPVS